MRFTNVVARWPGSTHDSFILANSLMGMRLQAGRVRDGWLLGDSGYPLKGWLMTPLTNPQTARELAYNHAHTITRAVVERAIGQLKCRWRCLDRSGGMLLYRPDKVGRIIIACATLHNLANRHGVPLAEVEEPANKPEPAPPLVQPHAAAIRARQRVIDTIDGKLSQGPPASA
ncbi:putative nuclease HARBI1 [Cololabis saira]|uniref:putative nuclease HARBI1 n=1 Tax=Cololabis saira TaxID=129043 RepID=UPI002AD408F5|nr:putative nuclease HARBI1 [Cololabis saira]